MEAPVEKKDPSLCIGPGCTRPAKLKGMCQTHYRQVERGRDLAPILDLREDLVKMTGCRVPPEVKEAMETEAERQGLSLYELQRRINEAWFAMHRAGLWPKS